MNEGGVQLLVLCLRQDVSINIWRNVLVLQQGIFHGRLTSAAGGITGLWIWLCLDVNIWFLLDFLSSYKGLNTNKSLNTQVNTQGINTSHTSIFIIFHFSWRIFFKLNFIHVLTSKTVTGEGVVRYIQTLPTLLTVETSQTGGAGVPVPLSVLWTQVHLYGTLGALQPDLDVSFWIRNLQPGLWRGLYCYHSLFVKWTDAADVLVGDMS